MGFFSKFFGHGTAQGPPALRSVYPTAALQKLRSGILPILQTDSLLLTRGENCHFADVAILVTNKKIYNRKHIGASFRICKGVTWHTGGGNTTPESIPDYTKGLLYITNRRVLFVAQQNGFEKKLSGLCAHTVFPDGIRMQFGEKSYSLLLADSGPAEATLRMLIS